MKPSRFRLPLVLTAAFVAVAACGGRSDLDPLPFISGDGEGGTNDGGSSGEGGSSTSTGISPMTTGVTSSTGTGGAPPLCEPPVVAWSQYVEDLGHVFDPASATDDDQNVFLFAAYEAPIEHGMVLQKIDPCGNVLFSRAMPDARPGTAVGGVFSQGRAIFGGEGVVLAFEPDGDPLWARSFEGATIYALAEHDGHVYVTGGFSGTVAFGTDLRTAMGGDDIFILRLDAAGGVDWVQTFGSVVEEQGAAIAVGATGNLCVGTRGGGSIQWGTMSGTSSAAILQLSGDTGEVRSAISTPDAETYAMTTIGEDCLAVGGYTVTLWLGPVALPTAVDGWNGFAARVGPLAQVVWARPFGPDFGMPRTIVVDEATDTVLIGGSLHGAWTFEDASVLGTEITKANSLFVLGLGQADGGYVWGRTFEGAIFHRTEEIHPMGDGAVILTGTFEGPGLDFGQGALGEGAPNSVFVARMDVPTP
ncbi:MAG: hypothetical protein HOV80_34475 [Polyangiaceae bacterium]|nr:hypothetical protein [Polyangiaceae bacterium]